MNKRHIRYCYMELGKARKHRNLHRTNLLLNEIDRLKHLVQLAQEELDIITSPTKD